MIFPLFRRLERPDTISGLYGMIVAQARMPFFYRDYAVPDTVNGRFDLIVLHMALLIDRLSQEAALRPMGQAIFNRFCQDMDHNLREMGIGDLAVPKEMRRIGEAFYGRAQAYRLALQAADNDVLAQVLARNIYGGSVPGTATIYGGSVPGTATGRLAAYTREAVRELHGQASADLAAGEVRFPEPAGLG